MQVPLKVYLDNISCSILGTVSSYLVIMTQNLAKCLVYVCKNLFTLVLTFLLTRVGVLTNILPYFPAHAFTGYNIIFIDFLHGPDGLNDVRSGWSVYGSPSSRPWCGLSHFQDH